MNSDILDYKKKVSNLIETRLITNSSYSRSLICLIIIILQIKYQIIGVGYSRIACTTYLKQKRMKILKATKPNFVQIRGLGFAHIQKKIFAPLLPFLNHSLGRCNFLVVSVLSIIHTPYSE